MGQVKPIELKKIAIKFIEKYYPQFLHRVDRIWDMFENIDINSFVTDSGEEQLGSAFGLTGTAEPGSQEPIIGIAILAFTYQTTKHETNLSKDEINKRISNSANILEIPPNVQHKLKELISEMIPSFTVESEAHIKHIQTQKINSEYSQFTKEYRVIVQRGIDNNKGLLIINGHQVGISSRECDLCNEMIYQLKKDWFKQDLERDRGWVSYDAFIKSVNTWKTADDAIGETVIIGAVNILNKKIEPLLKTKGLDSYLIQNGNNKLFNWPKHYRFRVHPDYLSTE